MIAFSPYLYYKSPSLWERFFAVHPDILHLWLKKQKYQDTKYDTFWCYLENDRSLIRAAAKLFIHRNTLVYHLKRIHELVEYNPEDTYTLDYMKISMRVLNMLEREKMIGGGVKSKSQMQPDCCRDCAVKTGIWNPDQEPLLKFREGISEFRKGQKSA